MRAVKNICGRWKPDKRGILFSWDISGMGNDRYIYIVGLKEENGRAAVDLSNSCHFDVADMQSTDQNSGLLPIGNLRAGVYKMRFCAYSVPDTTYLSDEEILDVCRKDLSFITSVVIGRACVSYAIDYLHVENCRIARIHTKSDCEIAAGVLGFRYCLDNCEVVQALPGSVPRGKTAYRPILIPKDCELGIVPIEKQFSGNVQVIPKKSKFLL